MLLVLCHPLSVRRPLPVRRLTSVDTSMWVSRLEFGARQYFMALFLPQATARDPFSEQTPGKIFHSKGRR
jgi:hypothetical protein